MSLTLKRLYLDFLRERYRGKKNLKVKIMLASQTTQNVPVTGRHYGI